MCLMLKRMQTSKVQIQANNQVWSSCFAVLVMFIFCGHFVIHFDKNVIALRPTDETVGRQVVNPNFSTTGATFND